MRTASSSSDLAPVRYFIPGALFVFCSLLLLAFLPGAALGQAKKPLHPRAKALARAHETAMPNLRKQPTLYLVGYAHLDTQWRWEYPQVISDYLLNTMEANFALFPKYPHYIFNFTGANRYMMMKEYFPADYAKLKKYVAEGRWFPAGSSMEENDVNSPSPESIIRQVLYGNEFFRKEFGTASEEFMLPDCFGFPADLPSILVAAGVKGFSTQKLTWGSSAAVGGPGSAEETPEGIPFNVGIWTGPDGSNMIAALNPGAYDSHITYDLTQSTPPPGVNDFIDWPARVERDGKVSGAYTDYHYYGTGDIGGAPDENSVKLVEKMVTEHKSNLRVISSNADDMFKALLAERLTAHLPRYSGDLELTNHSAGSLTSEAVHKRWNRENELLAAAAEEASVGAMWLGGRPYPLARLNYAWRLVLGGQFHDLMAGTATPKAYTYTWNDDVIAMNQFAGVLTSATSAIAQEMNTEVRGTPILVYNPLSIARQDVVTANVKFPAAMPSAVRVYGPDGKEVRAQLDGEENGSAKILFLANVPSVGFAVYDVEAADTSVAPSSELKASDSMLENARYRIQINSDGDISSIYDKKLGRELLAGPARLAFETEKPSQWPAWNMDWSDQSKPPRGYVDGPAKIRVVENGPVRVAVRIEREAEGSKFVQTIRLSAGDSGNRIEFANAIDWKTREAALKAVFPLTASNPQATYNWGAGTIERSNDNQKTFEMASHQWFDLTDKSGAFGVTMLSGPRTGSDKPNDNTLRLTLLYTPGISPSGESYRDQATQDWGHHEFVYGLMGHSGKWGDGETVWQAYRLDRPLIAFGSDKHAGTLGKTFSLLRLNSDHIRLMALKKAENGSAVIVRLVEMKGEAQKNVRISFAEPAVAARQVDGQERPRGEAMVTRGDLDADFGPYQIRSFAVRLAPARVHEAAPEWRAVALPYNLAAASDDGTKSVGGFDAAGDALPAEMLPQEVHYSGIQFKLAAAKTGVPDAVATNGQKIPLPAGRFNRVYLLAAAADGDQKGTFRVGDASYELTVQDWGGFIGQWYDRTFKMEPRPVPPEPDPSDTSEHAQNIRRLRARLLKNGPEMLPHFVSLAPGFIKRAPVAWFASHHHTADGANVPYSYSYLFAYELDVPPGAKTLTLPDNNNIRVMAVTLANEKSQVAPAQPLYDRMKPAGD